MNADLMEAPATPALGLTCSIERTALLRIVSSIAPAAAVKSSLPVLGAIRLEAVDGRLVATATNLDTWVRASAPAEVSTVGVALLAAPLLRDCIDRMPGGQIQLRESAQRTTLKSGTARAALNGLSGEEYPAMPTVRYGEERLSWPALSAALKRVAWAASSESSRPIINGISWRSAKGITKICATSGHSLALATLKVATPIEDAIIPATAVPMLLKLFAGEQEIEVGRGGAFDGNVSFIGFRSDDAEILIRLIDGPYPNYEQVIPTSDSARMVRVPVAETVAAIRRVGVCASATTRRISFTFRPQGCTVLATTADLGESVDLVSSTGWEGDAFEIGFNREIITAALTHAGSEEVDAAFRHERGAGVFTPVTPSPDFDWLGLVMPMKLL